MQDIFIGELRVSRVQPDLNTRKVSEELTTSREGYLVRLGDFDCSNENMVEPHHPPLHHERLLLSLVRE